MARSARRYRTDLYDLGSISSGNTDRPGLNACRLANRAAPTCENAGSSHARKTLSAVEYFAVRSERVRQRRIASQAWRLSLAGRIVDCEMPAKAGKHRNSFGDRALTLKGGIAPEQDGVRSNIRGSLAASSRTGSGRSAARPNLLLLQLACSRACWRQRSPRRYAAPG